MPHLLRTLSTAALVLLVIVSAAVSQTKPANPGHVADAFASGWMLLDTNGDGLIDAVAGKVVVPSEPNAAQNAAAAEIAARIGFASTGLTPPLVIRATEDAANGPRIWVSSGAVPAKYAADVSSLVNRLQQNEGGVFELDGNVIVLGQNDAGLLAAAEGYAAHAPYLWKAPGEKLASILEVIGQNAAGANTALSGVTYRSGVSGVSRAFLRTDIPVTAAVLEIALKSARLDQVHELVVTAQGGVSVSFTSEKPLPAAPPAAPAAGSNVAAATAPDTAAVDAPPQRMDLATLYTMRGLFRGTPKMPIPSNLDSQLYVPAGRAA